MPVRVRRRRAPSGAGAGAPEPSAGTEPIPPAPEPERDPQTQPGPEPEPRSEAEPEPEPEPEPEAAATRQPEPEPPAPPVAAGPGRPRRTRTLTPAVTDARRARGRRPVEAAPEPETKAPRSRPTDARKAQDRPEKAQPKAEPAKPAHAPPDEARPPGAGLIRWLAWLCAAVLVVTVAVAWAERRPDLTQEDARTFARRALEEAGFDDVDVAPAVAAGRDQPVEGTDGEVLDVWVTAVTVDTGTIALWVHQKEAQATRAYGTGPDGAPLLTPEQYDILDDYTRDPALERRYRRNYAVTAGGGLGAVVGLALGARLRRPGTGSG